MRSVAGMRRGAPRWCCGSWRDVGSGGESHRALEAIGRASGRLGAEAYAGAERVECRHEELAVGQRCPVCGQGRLYALPPGVEIRIDGNALLSAIRYEVEKLRCSACGQVFTAPLPEEASEEKYSPRARAVLAVGRYYLGLPLYRMESYQAMLGVPVPDATQWDQIERVADSGYSGVCASGGPGGPGRADLPGRHSGTDIVADRGKPEGSGSRGGHGLGAVRGPHGDVHHGLGGQDGRAHRSFCIIQAARMRGKTSRHSWTNGRRVWTNRW